MSRAPHQAPTGWPGPHLLFTALLLTGCVVNPVPTPGSAENRDESGAADAGAIADSALAGGGGDAGKSTDTFDPAEAVPPGVLGQTSNSISDFCDPWAEWTCERAQGCGCKDDKGRAVTAKHCRATMAAYCIDDYKKMATAMKQLGVVVLRRDRVQPCLASAAAAVPVCAPALRKYLPFDGGCADLFVDPAVSGQKCAGFSAACLDATGCVAGKCGAVRKDNGQACAADGDCKSLQCSSDKPNVCQGPPKVGDSCEDDFECPPYGACDGGKCKGPPAGEKLICLAINMFGK